MVVYLSVALVSAGYAALLNIKRVHNWYTPDWTWATVVAGNGIILGGLAAMIGLSALWWAVFYLNCAAGGPIIVWQLIRKVKRRRRAKRILQEK